jgi:hypothetical protein
MIAMDPEMAAIFKASMAVSSKYLPSTSIKLDYLYYSNQGPVSQSAPERQQEEKDQETDRGREGGCHAGGDAEASQTCTVRRSPSKSLGDGELECGRSCCHQLARLVHEGWVRPLSRGRHFLHQGRRRTQELQAGSGSVSNTMIFIRESQAVFKTFVNLS